MKKVLYLSFLLCLLSPTIFGQTQHLILTKEQNTKWLDSLKILTLDHQLITIKDRLLSDTNVFVRQSYPDKIKITDSLRGRVYGDGKPTLIIGGYAIIIDNKTQKEKIESLTKLLTPTYIKSILILSPNDPATTALYGQMGQCGIIIMTVTKKKNVRLFTRLKLDPNY